MDPQTVSFIPRDDLWRFQSDMMRIQQTQADHAERLLRVERRQDEDARVRSVWGSTSPFPSGLTGTPQQGKFSDAFRFDNMLLTARKVAVHQPPADVFDNFDDQQNNMLGSLHLDAEDEPRRVGSASRANSVRFDESANQGHWSQNSRTSIDFIHRTGSGMGGLAMTERSSSHKSDGRQSSASQSIHSGRANCFPAEVATSANGSSNSNAEIPGLVPGLLVLGPVPSIIRCWLTQNFRHDTLLYAAICTGSYVSTLYVGIIEHLGLEEHIRTTDEGQRRIKLPMYLPEAVSHQSSSRFGSPVHQLPTLTVDFVVTNLEQAADSRAIQIIIGSDVLRARNADVLLSLNKLVLLDDERSKLSIPLVRPEDERVFKSLLVRSFVIGFQSNGETREAEDLYQSEQANRKEAVRPNVPGEAPANSAEYHSPVGITTGASSSSRDTFNQGNDVGEKDEEVNAKPQRPMFRNLSKQDTNDENSLVDQISPTPARESPSVNLWSNWRRDGDKQNQGDWANTGRGQTSNYHRRDVGIKVLKPARSTSRTLSSPHVSSVSPGAGQSRFFDDGRRRSAAVGEAMDSESKRSVSSETQSNQKDKEKDNNQLPSGKPRSANPIGGASAFAWLNSGSAK